MAARQQIVDTSDENFLQDFISMRPLLTSYESSWDDISFIYSKTPVGAIPEHICPQHIITIPYRLPKETITVESLVDGKMRPIPHHVGEINFDPINTPRQYVHKHVLEGICICIGSSLVENIDPNHFNPDSIELVQIYGQEDPLLYQIGATIKKELESGKICQPYIESLTSLLSVHIIKNYASRKLTFKEYKGGLSHYKLNQVVDYINDNISKEISLKELANLIGISQYYFSRLFKSSMGVSPYQYITQQRITKAKRLLADCDVDLSEIALRCGFTHQSHLNRHFKNHTGTTPKRYRNSFR